MRGAELSIDMRLSRAARSARFACFAIACFAVSALSPRGARAEDFGVKLPTVRRIEILGNRSFDDDALKKRMRTKEARFYKIFRQPTYRRDFLRRDVEAIESFYRTNGFFEATVRIESVEPVEEGNAVKIRLVVVEGPQTRVGTLGFSPQSIVRESDLRKRLKLVEKVPYNPNLLETDQYSILSEFYEKGHLGAKAIAATHVDSTSADIEWNLAAGEPVFVRSSRVSGARTVREDLVRRELTFKPGDLCTTKRMLESTQNLYDTGYFTSVEINPDTIDLDRQRVDLSVKVRERKKGYVEVGVGVGNVYGNRLTGEWGQRDIFGTGYLFILKSSYAFQLFPNNEYRLSNIDFKSRYLRNEGELRFPHILGTWNTFSVSAFYERDATVEPVTIKDRGFAARIARRFSRETSLLFSYSLERIERLEVEEEKARSQKRTIDASFSRDTRDLYFNPQRGTYLTGDGSFSGGFLGGSDNYYSLVGVWRRYARIGRSSVFACRLRGGYTDAFGSTSETGLPIEARFFAGGGNSIRGFRENAVGPLGPDLQPAGGRITLLTNAEMRVPIPYLARFNFGAALFLDGGGVWYSAQDITPSDFRFTAPAGDVSRSEYMYGAGFGLRYYTPVGPLRLDIGFPLKKTSDIDYDYLVHISLGQIF
jgi:outer membrane protein insertion porin family